MSRFEDRIQNHKLWDHLATLEELAPKLGEEISEQDLGENHRAEVERMKDVVNHVDRSLNAADPYLVSEGVLSNINSQLEHAVNHIRNYRNNNQVGQLENANGRLDNVLQHISQIPIPKTPEDLEGLRDRLTRFRQSAGSLATYMERDLESVREKVSEIEANLEQKGEEVDETLRSKITEIEESSSQTNQQLKQELEGDVEDIRNQLTDHKQEIQTQKQRLEDAITESKQQFIDGASERNDKFETEQDNRREKFSQTIGAIEGTGRGFVERMEEYEAQVVKQMEVIGTTGMTGGFKKTANYEREQADYWRRVTVLAMIAVVAAAFWTTLETMGAGRFMVGAFASKVFLTATIGILAGYAGSQSATHRGRERRAKQLELELASLDPYLSALPDDDQTEVKVDLIKRWFGRLPDEGDEEEITKKSLFETLRDFGEWGFNKGVE